MSILELQEDLQHFPVDQAGLLITAPRTVSTSGDTLRWLLSRLVVASFRSLRRPTAGPGADLSMGIGACGPVVMGSSAGQVKGAPDVLTKLTIPRVDEGAQLRLWAPSVLSGRPAGSRTWRCGPSVRCGTTGVEVDRLGQ